MSSNQFYQSKPPPPPPPPPATGNTAPASSFYGRQRRNPPPPPPPPTTSSSETPGTSGGYYNNAGSRASNSSSESLNKQQSSSYRPTYSHQAPAPASVPAVADSNEWFTPGPSAVSSGSSNNNSNMINTFNPNAVSQNNSSNSLNNQMPSNVPFGMMGSGGGVPQHQQNHQSSDSLNDLSGPMTSGSISNNMSSTYLAPTTDTNFYDFENEPPLLEELGINIEHIIAKSRAVILPSSRLLAPPPQSVLEDDELAGPLAFALLLGGELLLTAKIHFGYIYGFGLFGCLAMALILNLMAPPVQNKASNSPSLWSVASILGYSLLPVNLLAFANILVSIKNLGAVGVTLGSLTVLWSTTASTRLFERSFQMRDQRYLMAYPCALLYSCFVIITIF